MRKIKIVLFIVLLMAFSILFTSCGDNSTIDFGNEARFCFDAERTAAAFSQGPAIDTNGNYLKINKDLKIKDIQIDFIKISKKEYENAKGINVIDCGGLKKKYSVSIFFTFEGEKDAHKYDFVFIGQIRDNYTLRINLKNIDLHADTELRCTMHFYKDNNGSIYSKINWDPIVNDYGGGIYMTYNNVCLI